MAGRLPLWFLSILHPLLLNAHVSGGGGGCCIGAIYSLGDSIADTGNAVHLGLSGAFAPSASLPYGETLKKATGRCSDGLLMIDYFGKTSCCTPSILPTALGLPYVPPYLDKSANFDHGVNFAVAGATALDQSFFLKNGIPQFTNSSLDVQLRWFNDHLKSSVCPSKQDCPKKLEKTLFFVGEIGGNDYNYPLMQGRPAEELKTSVPQVVRKIVDAAKEVIDVGAVQLIVPGNFPIGCFPIYLTTFKQQDSEYDKRGCLKDLNNFAQFHNQHLGKALEDLKKDHPNVTIIYADYYNMFLNIHDRADNYGFDKSSLLKACCGTGSDYNFNMNRMCGSLGVPVCSDPTKFISWDGIHLTQEAYKNMANQLLNIELLKKWKC
ncbi:hypothetical protein Taro_016805 [Colocasia esculenta]|uniref:Uncharacterized protein n=1 Tax=Colocasia esculenta TaxID=4460 RepID=A0A843UPJ4_COLES|nr:hypothetical protein [Colocasia esculenta]